MALDPILMPAQKSADKYAVFIWILAVWGTTVCLFEIVVPLSRVKLIDVHPFCDFERKET